MGVNQHSDAIERVEPFLSALAFGGDLDETGESCHRVELRQLISGAPNQPMRDWPILPDTDVAALAEEIIDYAQKDAASYANPNRYVVVAYFDGDDSQFRRRSPTFLLRGLAYDSDDHVGPNDIIESEPATAKGLLTQLMRHTEALSRTLVGSQSHILAMYQEELRAARAQATRANELHLELIEQLEEISTHKHERELENRREESNQKIRAELLEDFRALAPAVVNKLGGKKLLPESTSPSEEALMRFMASVDDEQREKIMTTLRPTQVVALKALFDRAIETAAAKEAREGKDKNGKAAEA